MFSADLSTELSLDALSASTFRSRPAIGSNPHQPNTNYAHIPSRRTSPKFHRKGNHETPEHIFEPWVANKAFDFLALQTLEVSNITTNLGEGIRLRTLGERIPCPFSLVLQTKVKVSSNCLNFAFRRRRICLLCPTLYCSP